MGFSTDDRRIPIHFLSPMSGLQYSFTANPNPETEIHPNTVDIHMTDENGQKLIVRGESVRRRKNRIAESTKWEVDFYRRIQHSYRHSTGQTRSDRTHHKLLKRNERQYSYVTF